MVGRLTRLLIVFILFLPFVFAGTVYNENHTTSTIDNSTYLIINESIFFNVTPVGWSSPGCEINLTGVYEAMTKTGESHTTSANFSNTYSGDIYFNCTDDDDGPNSFSLTVNPRWRIIGSSEKLAMVNVSTTYSVDAFSYDENRTHAPLSNCNYSIGEGVIDISSGNVSYDKIYTTAGMHNLTVNCTYDGNPVSTTFPINATAYEPKLGDVTDYFTDISSGSDGYKLGHYDFNLDGVEDIVVIGSQGLFVYDGSNISTWQYNNTNYTHGSGNDYEFLIADVDADGDGDIIVYNLTVVDSLKFNEWEFTRTNITNGSGIQSVGFWDLNKDFYKDIVVLNYDSPDWVISYYQGASDDYSLNHSQGFNSGTCVDILVFDYDKDFDQELLCRSNSTEIDVFEKDINGYINITSPDYNNVGFKQGVSTVFFSNLFFSKYRSNQSWRIGMLRDDSTDDLYFYNFTPSLITHTVSDKILISTDNNLYDRMSVDVMMEDKAGELVSYYIDGGNRPFEFYYNDGDGVFAHPDTTVTKGITQFDYDGDNDTDVLSSYFDSGFLKLKIIQNNISDYRSPSWNYSIDTNTFNETESADVQFNISINESWLNDYFFTVSFYSKVYRNDYYDSKQNMKYYMINNSGWYTFNHENENGYELSISPNTHSAILANATTVIYQSDECEFGDDDPFNWTISRFCSGFGGEDFESYEPNDKWLIVNNTKLDWNNVNITSVHILFNGTEDNVIKNSHFFNYTDTIIEITGMHSNRVKQYYNVTFHNVTVSLDDVSINFTNVTFVNSTVNAIDATITLNNTDVAYGMIQYSIVHIYNSSVTATNINSDFRSYNCSTVSFVDSDGPLSRVGNYSGSSNVSFSGSSVSSCFLMKNNSAIYSYNFNFTTDWNYFDADVSYFSFNDTETIVFNKTHIPDWNYSLNTSHMTDFRNYALLSNISNISGVLLSRAGINITLQGYANLSDVNLSDSFTSGANEFNVSLNSSFAFNFSTNVSSRYVVLQDLDLYSNATTLTSGILSGIFSSGNYSVVNNLTFGHSLPNIIYAYTNFSISVNYSDYFEATDYSTNCSLTAFGGTYGISNISFPAGRHDYNLSCNSSDLDLVSANGTIVALGLSATVPAVYRYSKFNMSVVYPGISNYSLECNLCRLNGSGVNSNLWNNTESSCVRTFEFEDTITRNYNVSCENQNQNLTITPIDAKKLWDQDSVLGDFWVFGDTRHFSITNQTAVVSYASINGSGNLYLVPNNIRDLGKTTTISEMFYYSGDIFNNGSTVEIIN